MKKWQNCVQKTVEVVQLVPQERIQERIAEQVVDIPLPQIMEEMMEVVLFSSTYASESRTVEQIVDVSNSSDSEGNFRVGVMRNAFHLAQILRAQATRSQVCSRSVVANCLRYLLFRSFRIFWIFQLGKVQNFPASFSSSELSAHQMAPSGVIAHWRCPCALEPPSSSIHQLHPRCRAPSCFR